MGCGSSSQAVESPRVRSSKTQGGSKVDATIISEETPTQRGEKQATSTSQDNRQSVKAATEPPSKDSQVSSNHNGLVKEKSKESLLFKEGDAESLSEEEIPGKTESQKNEKENEDDVASDFSRPLSVADSEIADDVWPVKKQRSEMSVISDEDRASNVTPVSQTEEERRTAEESAAIVANVIQMASEHVHQLEEMEEENDSSLNEGSVQSVKDDEWASSSSLKEAEEGSKDNRDKSVNVSLRTAGQISLHEKEEGEKQVSNINGKTKSNI